MAILTGLVSFTAGTPAVASQVNTNFTAVKNFVESITTGTNIDAGAISFAKLAADVVNKLVPVGTVAPYVGATAPTGWLLCDGTTSTAGHPLLAAMVGATTPDFRGRTLVGRSASAPFNGALLSVLGSTTSVAAHSHVFSAGVASSAGTGHAHNVAQNDAGLHQHTFTTDASQGAHQHKLTANQVASGTHGHTANGTLASGLTGAGGSTSAFTNTLEAGYEGKHGHSGATTSEGSHNHGVTVPSGGEHSHTVTGTVDSVGDAHGNIQPSALINYIIKHD